ncbi:MAG: translation initiation factor IF-3 [Candidatus Shapirobacteria bacterium]|nr:translation initiation factor IF-3 [Candidatus Shapirobacteria bacterium]
MNLAKFYQINQYIRAERLRVVDENSKQIDILDRDKALELAKKEGKDLVEIAPKANPPVAKIIDFKKFQYLESKKAKKSKKLGQKQETKELRLRPFISNNDLQFRIRKSKDFLKNGDRVQITINFRGREMTNKDAGFKLASQFIESLKNFGSPIREPKMSGKSLIFTLTPTKND